MRHPELEQAHGKLRGKGGHYGAEDTHYWNKDKVHKYIYNKAAGSRPVQEFQVTVSREQCAIDINHAVCQEGNHEPSKNLPQVKGRLVFIKDNHYFIPEEEGN